MIGRKLPPSCKVRSGAVGKKTVMCVRQEYEFYRHFVNLRYGIKIFKEINSLLMLCPMVAF